VERIINVGPHKVLVDKLDGKKDELGDMREMGDCPKLYWSIV
jgi:hypothetical protein